MTENPATRIRDVGDLLIERQKLSSKQLDLARRRQQRLNLPLHRAIADLNCTSEEDIYRALAEMHRLEFVDISKLQLSKPVLELVPMHLAFQSRLIPLSKENEVLTLAFAEPPRPSDLSSLRLLLQMTIKPVLTTPSCVNAVLKSNFGIGAETIQRLREEDSGRDEHREIVFDIAESGVGTQMEATITAFVDQILGEALRLRATDIHIEPYHSSIRLRYRIDGVLQSVPVPAGFRDIHTAVVSRLKIMAELNIAERRLPHDGRISMKAGGDEYDLRISVIPTKHGETICLRILGRNSLLLELSQLGMEPAHETMLKELTELPQGFVLITGPTGSGKTTTLYAALAHANDEGRKIITIEDPVEYKIDGISQIQVRDEIGLTFASGLRSVLRHDPDVVLIGEIRDSETAGIAVRAAQTGHLVLSTLHTNDSISAVTRLLEMGIDPFLLGSSLVCSIAQRLAQRICRHCMVGDQAIPDPVRQEMAETLKIAPEQVRAWKGTGCVECNDKGYRGRVAIYEFFVVNEELADSFGPGMKTHQLRREAGNHGWRSIREMAWNKVQEGIITVEEVQRLTRRIG